jgi:uncharacterized protein
MPLMLCPNDNTSMTAVVRNGVEFDMCPVCRGVWLDRGELEKLMAAGGERPAPRPVEAPPTYRRDHDDDDHRYEQKRRKKKGFDLFDIFD